MVVLVCFGWLGGFLGRAWLRLLFALVSLCCLPVFCFGLSGLRARPLWGCGLLVSVLPFLVFSRPDLLTRTSLEMET